MEGPLFNCSIIPLKDQIDFAYQSRWYSLESIQRRASLNEIVMSIIENLLCFRYMMYNHVRQKKFQLSAFCLVSKVNLGAESRLVFCC